LGGGWKVKQKTHVYGKNRPITAGEKRALAFLKRGGRPATRPGGGGEGKGWKPIQSIVSEKHKLGRRKARNWLQGEGQTTAKMTGAQSKPGPHWRGGGGELVVEGERRAALPATGRSAFGQSGDPLLRSHKKEA